MSLHTDLFFFFGGTENDYILVEIVGTEMSPDNLLFFADIMYVKEPNQGELIRLEWDDFDACYVGTINGKEGYIQ